MTYALVQNDVIVQTGYPPPVWNDGERDWDTRQMSDAELAELGWLVIVATERPPNTDLTTFDYSVQLVGGVPTEVWTERPWTAEELAASESQQNVSQMTAEQSESVDKLVLVVENLNAITDMTNADINANPAAIIKDVARELKTVARVANREARLTSSRTESTDTGEEVPE
jgi:hypothetical protein